ncbi:MAG: hypothetical protein ACTS8S_00450 [Giesbergeria sp.]
MTGVNGVEIKVGQVWRTRGGYLATVVGEDDHPAYPVNITVDGDAASCGRNGRCWGGAANTSDDEDDLIELVKGLNDSAAIAEETLSALGWTFDGQAWVEQPKAELPVGMLDNPVSAPALLTAAAKHMYDRAAIYDKPEGERSMAQTVAVFEAHHGIKLTEAQGWHFMQVLKDVRLFTRETYHGDSAEDCIAYAALKAEAKAQEPTHG